MQYIRDDSDDGGKISHWKFQVLKAQDGYDGRIY